MQKKQYRRLDRVYEIVGTINKDDKKLTFKKHSKSDLIYEFFKYYETKKFDNLFLGSFSILKYFFLVSFSNDLDEVSKLKPQKEKKQKRKKQM